MEPTRTMLDEIDAIRLTVEGVRFTRLPDRSVYPAVILIDVRYRNSNRKTIELTEQNAWELKRWLEDAVPGEEPSANFDGARQRARERKAASRYSRTG